MRERLREALAPYRQAHPDARWTSPASWHLTLLFLGHEPASRLPQLERVVDDVARACAPLWVSLTAGGGRLEKHGGVAWLNVARDDSGVVALADRTLARWRSDAPTAGEPPARRTPSPHLTVARRADAAVIASLREQRFGALEARWQIDRIVLMRSDLGPAGARYETLHGADCTLPAGPH